MMHKDHGSRLERAYQEGRNDGAIAYHAGKDRSRQPVYPSRFWGPLRSWRLVRFEYEKGLCVGWHAACSQYWSFLAYRTESTEHQENVMFQQTQPARSADLHALVSKAKKYTSDDVRKAMHKVLMPQDGLVILDTTYWALPVTTWDALIKAVGPDTNKYKSERYDCDDFAVVFKGKMSNEFEINGVGWVIDESSSHSYDCVLVDVGASLPEVHFIEPQNDRWVRSAIKQPTDSHYQLTKGLVII